MKNKLKLFLTTACILLLAACGQNVPENKTNYIGNWTSQSPLMELQITAEGQVRYTRQEENTTKSLDLPLQEFEGDNFKAGIGPASTQFIVNKPPFQENEQWKMVVDGVTLTKTN